MLKKVRRSGVYTEKRVGLTRANRMIVYALVFSCIALTGLWYLFFSGFWSVSQIQVDGLQTLGRGEVVSSTYEILDGGGWKPWDKRNVILLNTQALASALKDRLFAENVAVEKSYPNILRLKITERQRSVVLASQSQLLSVDTNGVVTGDVPSDLAVQVQLRLTDKALADFVRPPIVVYDLPEMATSGYQVADPKTVQAWIETYRALISAGVTFRYMKLGDISSPKVSVVTDKGWEAIFDVSRPLGPQIETYTAFLRSKDKNLRISQYVDVRVPGKIYVK